MVSVWRMGPRAWSSLLLGVGLLALALGAREGLSASAPAFQARVVRVTDGDTLEVLRGRERIRVRLEGIDCPELRPPQPFGRKAKDFTSERAFGKTVRVRVVTTDRYGRQVCRVAVGGRDLGADLLRAGLAWHYKHFNQEAHLAQLEAQARAQRRGLWADPKPMPPWEWRRSSRQTGLAPGSGRLAELAQVLE